MPRPHADRFEENKADATLVSTREQLALVNTMLEDRLREMYDGSPPQAWKLARELFLEHQKAANIMNRSGLRSESGRPMAARGPDEILAGLGQLLEIWIKTSQTFELTQKMLETHRRAVETELKLLKENQNRMEVSEVRMFAARLADSVKRHVKDADILRSIQADMRRVVSTRF